MSREIPQPEKQKPLLPVVSKDMVDAFLANILQAGEEIDTEGDLKVIEENNPALYKFLMMYVEKAKDEYSAANYLTGGVLAYRLLYRQAEADAMNMGNINPGQDLLPKVDWQEDVRTVSSKFKKDPFHYMAEAARRMRAENPEVHRFYIKTWNSKDLSPLEAMEARLAFIQTYMILLNAATRQATS